MANLAKGRVLWTHLAAHELLPFLLGDLDVVNSLELHGTVLQIGLREWLMVGM
jgi:hypothetical protein